MTRAARIWLLPALALAASGQETLTLDRAVDMAMKNSRLVRVAELEVRKSGDQVAAARTYRLPQFNFKLFASQLFTNFFFTIPRGTLGTFPGLGPLPPRDSPITTGRHPNVLVIGQASQPLSQLHRIGLGIHLQELARAVNREKLEAQQQAVANNVKKVYYGLLQAQSALDATEESIKLYAEMERVMEQNLAQQVVLKADSLEVKTRLAKARYDAVTLRNTQASLREQLNDLMGRDLRTEFRTGPLPESTDYTADLEQARTRALAQRPELREARLKIRQAEYDRSMKKSEYLPDLSLDFHYLSPFSIAGVPKNIFAGGLMLNWDVFDWGRKKRELGVKEKTIEQARTGLQEQEALVLIEVDSRYRKLEETRALLQVDQLAMETARERVRVTMNRYRQEAALLKDALQMQAALAEANYQYQQALLSFWTARADFEKALGER